MIRSVISFCALIGSLAVTVPAHAANAVDEIALSRADNGPCKARTWVKDRSIVIRGAGTRQIELYGWFLDKVDTAHIEGLPGASVRIDNRRPGHENVRAGCSANGSAVLSLTLPAVSEIKSATLRLDDQRVPLRIIPGSLGFDLSWKEDNEATGNEPTEGARQARYTAYVAQQNADRDRCLADNPATESAMAQCRRLYAAQPIDTVFPDENRLRNTLLTRCAAPHGLTADLNKQTLTITLPADRSQIGRCAIFPMTAAYTRYLLDDPDLDMQAEPTATLTRDGPLPNGSATAVSTLGSHEVTSAVSLRREELENLVGTYRQVYRRQGLMGADTITLIVKSDPDYGVKTATAPYVNPGVGRLGPEVGITVQPVQPTTRGQVFGWILMGTGFPPAQCFTAVRGEFTPPADQARFVLPLTVKENPDCYGKAFTFEIGPRGAVDRTLYGHSLTFVLAAPAQVRGNGNLTDDRIKIQGQSLIRQ